MSRDKSVLMLVFLMLTMSFAGCLGDQNISSAQPVEDLNIRFVGVVEGVLRERTETSPEDTVPCRSVHVARGHVEDGLLSGCVASRGADKVRQR